MIRRLLAWLRTWGDMESTGRYAWGPDDPPPYDLSPAADDHLDCASLRRLAWDARFDNVLHATPGDIDGLLAERDPEFAEWLREEGP